PEATGRSGSFLSWPSVLSVLAQEKRERGAAPVTGCAGKHQRSLGWRDRWQPLVTTEKMEKTVKSTRTPHRTGRRGNNEGSITQLSDGRWQARLTLENGQRKAYYGKTRAEVQQKLTVVLHDRDKGLPVGMDERQTVAQYLVGWLETIKPTIRPRTW